MFYRFHMKNEIEEEEETAAAAIAAKIYNTQLQSMCCFASIDFYIL